MYAVCGNAAQRLRSRVEARLFDTVTAGFGIVLVSALKPPGEGIASVSMFCLQALQGSCGYDSRMQGFLTGARAVALC